ncbi:MAG TPA: pre-peptidase C-terminal domain-containing protein [Allosphingosinicella sp.]|nr:pre-peptidase C-terminal domain-containing protein [Allosphingosinicella sp.]
MAMWLALAAAPLSAQGRQPTAIDAGSVISAELSTNDDQRRSGKYEDVFQIQGQGGGRIDLRLSSADFDTFLLVSGPDGFTLSNDDHGGGTDSRLVVEFPASGVYRVTVTTFRPGETGNYRLQATIPDADVAATTAEPAEPITIGTSLTGRLEAGDDRLGSGGFVDRYRFTARRGQRVTASVTSGEFDTYLILRRPDGSQDGNDDISVEAESSTNSRLDTVLADDGVYVLTVTSFQPGETGKYRLSLAPSPGHPRQVNVRAGPRVLALLVGVADYGERANPLPNTDEDARQLFAGLRTAGLLHPASRILTNGEATTKSVSAAFAEAAAQAGPDDLFLFFFSGHGNQLDVPRSAAELDGRSETIELYDAAVTDVELGRLFSSVGGRMALVAIDACYAGGFRNLISRPNVMGLFSSEEDLTSLVASQFKAGGFLSYFLRTGLAGAADDDGDGIVTAGELATYVRRRFRREGDIPASTREDEANFQNLIIERGGVHIDDVVVRLATGSAATAAGPRLPQAGDAVTGE